MGHEYKPGDGWYAEGRVPGPWRTIVVGPYTTPVDAGRAGREKRLGGQHLFQVRDGRRVV